MGRSKEEANEYAKEYYKKNKDDILLRTKKYKEENKDAVKLRSKAYYEKNKEALAEKKKAYREENKEYLEEKRKRYREENKEKISNRRKEYREKNKEKIRENHSKWYNSIGKDYKSDPKNVMNSRASVIKKKYGISIDELSDMLDKQKGCCKICGETLIRPDSQNSYHIDHNHDTGDVRGLLCSNCNMAIGLMYDNPEIVMSVYNYLKG